MEFGSALMALFIVGVLKIVTMLTTAWMLIKLTPLVCGWNVARPWLDVPREHIPEMRLLWWALVFFGISELTCGVETYVILQSSLPCGGAHSVSSGLGMGLFALAFYIHLDKRLFAYGRPACILNRVCAGCTINDPVGCKFSGVLKLLALFFVLAALIPLFASTARININPDRFILPFDSWNQWYDRVVVPWISDQFPGHDLSGTAKHFVSTGILTIEFRILPILALLGALAAMVLMMMRREAPGLKVLMLAIGILAFVYLDLVLYRGIGDATLAAFGHESTEIWFLAITAVFLRRSFCPERKPRPAGAVQEA